MPATHSYPLMSIVSFPTWMFILSPISHLLLVLNSSLNFLIYCFVGARFFNMTIMMGNEAHFLTI